MTDADNSLSESTETKKLFRVLIVDEACIGEGRLEDLLNDGYEIESMQPLTVDRRGEQNGIHTVAILKLVN
jgi:hypothetical protein